jgi:uncharacterized membrane protein YgdD (TMEM256/DUF423 family)
VKTKNILMLAAFFAMTSVAIGAFAAHGLKHVMQAKQLQWIETASTYQMYHALALLAVAVLMMKVGQSKQLLLVCYSFVLGVMLFSGSLYALAVTQIKSFVYLTPVGGVFFLIGWLVLIYAASKLSEK